MKYNKIYGIRTGIPPKNGTLINQKFTNRKKAEKWAEWNYKNKGKNWCVVILTPN